MTSQPTIEDVRFAARLSVTRSASALLITLLLIFTGVVSVWLYQSYDAARRHRRLQKSRRPPFIAVSAADYRVGMLPFWVNEYAVIVLSLLTLAGTTIAAWWIYHLPQRNEYQTQVSLHQMRKSIAA